MILLGFKEALLKSHMPKASLRGTPPNKEEYPNEAAYKRAWTAYYGSDVERERAEFQIEKSFLLSKIEEVLGVSEAETLATIEVLKVEGLLGEAMGARGDVISREGLQACRTFTNETK